MRSLVLIAVVACGSTEAEPTQDPCSAAALGLGSAKALVAWKAPAGCTARGGSSPPKLLTTEADARAQFDCKDPKANFAVDFKTKSLVASTGSWSPAQVGLSAFDDGKKVTLVSRQRAPCKGDPQPMPSPAISSLFVGGTGVRTFAQSSCTVVTKCP